MHRKRINVKINIFSLCCWITKTKKDNNISKIDKNTGDVNLSPSGSNAVVVQEVIMKSEYITTKQNENFIMLEVFV